ncbi:hypothetical protein [Crossiella sp. CA198]|uniref:hypothetical protein n=1 Tax=Crossiella sp. CA198 TaxID=3455607 RepID=UPI003F8D2C8D
MQAIVQCVQTSWTKQSRGGAAATLRNAAPTAFALPARRPPFTHEVRMDERSDFQPRFDIRDEDLPDPPVKLQEADGLLRIQLEVTPYGMPRRWRRPPARRIGPGEWLRWQVNYRFVSCCSGDWNYRLDTLNIGYGVEGTEVFLGTPTHTVDERAGLF